MKRWVSGSRSSSGDTSLARSRSTGSPTVTIFTTTPGRRAGRPAGRRGGGGTARRAAPRGPARQALRRPMSSRRSALAPPDRGGGQRLGGRHPALADGERDAERDARRVARAGVAVGGQRDGDAGVEQPARVGVRLAGRELDAGQERGDGAARRQRVDVGVVGERHVVGRRRAELDGDLHAGPVAELVGVDARLQALLDPGLQHGARLLAVERAPLAEDVDPARVRRARVEHLAAHEVDVVVGVVPGRDDVGAEERGLGRVGPRDLQRAALVLDREAVARLALDRRGARSGAPRRRGGRRWRAARSSVAARVASTVVRIPPAV